MNKKLKKENAELNKELTKATEQFISGDKK